ncbi:unnamed protein product [Auanema sp. JU1783]|nr:unnamed protein product [Auanema sp. JU1783]
MADKELAAKLAKRLACVQDENENDEIKVAPPPAPPVFPQKTIENPYVEVDNSVSIDDLIQKALERKEENNNNVPPPVPSSPVPPAPSTSVAEPPSSPKRILSSPTIPPPPPPSTQSCSPVSSSSPVPPIQSVSTVKGVPPKTTIRDLLQKEFENNPSNVQSQSKCPMVSIEHHKRPETPTKRCSPEFDGSELELKLAAQRNRKAVNPVLCDENRTNLIYSNTEQSTPSTLASPDEQPRESPSLPDFPPPPPLPSQAAQPTSPTPPPKPSRVHAADALPAPPQPQLLQSAIETIPEEPPKKKDSFEELEEQVAREIAEQEARQQKEMEEQSSSRPITPVKSPEVLRTKMGNIPSPLLIEMIKTECGSSRPSTPPPVPPPKPQSRPQSPVVRKPFVSPLGLLCDPLMSVETDKPIPSPPIKKISPKVEENPDELNAMLERRTKILEGDVQPQFVNRKLSLYAEFSEFSRKQIKFFQETFKKFDEDCDGFIDFNELKRMMEKLGEAQTHISLKDIIKKVDEDNDGKISMREFFLLFRLAAQGQLGCSEVFTQLAESVDVSKEGVLAAASFFQAKIAEQTKLSKFEEEIKQEQEEKRRDEEEKKKRREKFLQNKSIFH